MEADRYAGPAGVQTPEELDRALGEPALPARLRAPRALLGAPTVRGLLRQSLTDWAMIAGCWAAMATLPSWTWPLWILLIAGRLHAAGVILHDLVHLPIRHKTWAVRAVELLAGYPIAITLDAMRYHHLRHHRDSGMPQDPYFKPVLHGRPVVFWLIFARHVILVPFWTIRGPIGLLAVAFPALRNAYGRVWLQDRSGADLTAHPEVIAAGRAELGQVLFTVAWMSAFVAFPGPVGWGYVAPAVLAGLLGGYRVLVEHVYVPTTDRRLETILTTTVDHDLGPLGRLFLAPRNIGYHVVHHLHPGVALGNLPALREWYRAELGDRYPAPRGLGTW